MPGGVSKPDPYLLVDTNCSTGFSNLVTTYNIYRSTSGLTARPIISNPINPANKTLVLLCGGQSLGANVTPTAFTPINAATIDQMNVHDGQLYSITSSLLGSTLNPLVGSPGFGNIFVRVADTLRTNGKFDRVILVGLNVGSTNVAQWATGGIHYNRFAVAMLRLAALGITPGMTGVTFAAIFDIGDDDFGQGTTQANMTSGLNSVISNLQATGFNGRIFIPLESNTGATSNAIRSAQAAVVTGNVKAGGDFDAIPGAQRADGTHWNDTGAATAAAALITAMGNSGAPF